MSIHLITGLPRNGKSYYCVTRIVEDLINEDRGIYTNLPIHPDILCKYVAVQKHDKKMNTILICLKNCFPEYIFSALLTLFPRFGNSGAKSCILPLAYGTGQKI